MLTETILTGPQAALSGLPRGSRIGGPLPCPSCGNLESYEDLATTERICSQRGLVLDSVRAVVQEGFGGEGDRETHGFSSHGPAYAPSRVSGLLRTQIGSLRSSGTGSKGIGQSSLRIHRLRQMDRRNARGMPRGRDLREASRQLHHLVATLGLPSHALESAQGHLLSAARRRDLRGLRTPLLVAASVALSSRENHVPRTLREVAKAAGISPHALASSLPRLARLLGSHLPLVSPADLLPHICGILNLSPEGRHHTVELLSRLQGLGYPTSGVMPSTLAGAAVLVATRNDPTGPSQAKVSRACGVTTVALRHQVRAMEQALAKPTIDDPSPYPHPSRARALAHGQESHPMGSLNTPSENSQSEPLLIPTMGTSGSVA